MIILVEFDFKTANNLLYIYNENFTQYDLVVLSVKLVWLGIIKYYMLNGNEAPLTDQWRHWKVVLSQLSVMC